MWREATKVDVQAEKFFGILFEIQVRWRAVMHEFYGRNEGGEAAEQSPLAEVLSSRPEAEAISSRPESALHWKRHHAFDCTRQPSHDPSLPRPKGIYAKGGVPPPRLGARGSAKNTAMAMFKMRLPSALIDASTKEMRYMGGPHE